MTNNFEHFRLATLRLSQDGPIKDRLADAYVAHLGSLEADELPESLRGDFRALCEAMHRESPQVRESPVRASVRKMSVHEASECAALVVRMFAAMARVEAMQGAGTRVPRPAAPVVSLFAAEG